MASRVGDAFALFLRRAAAAVILIFAVYGAWQFGAILAAAQATQYADLLAGETPPDAAPAGVPPPPEPAGKEAVAVPLEEPEDLRRRGLLVPVAGVPSEELRDSFAEARGSRRHEALDIAAPRGTPVMAVDDGVIARLFESALGGLTVYQFDPNETWAYYYAHLESYARGLDEGDRVARGEVIGYVGTSGNAPAHAPHLHFAIFRLTPEKRWWEGDPVNPFPVFRR